MPGDRGHSQPPVLVWDCYRADSRAAREKLLSTLDEHRVWIERNPRDVNGYIALAACWKSLHEHATALAVLREGLDRCPPSTALYRTYIASLKECNRVEDAIRAAEEALRALPDAGDAGVIRIAQRLALPILYDTMEEVEHYRRRFQAELTVLCQETKVDAAQEKAHALQAAASWVNFYLAYQGRDDRALQREYGQLLGRVMAANYPQWVLHLDMPSVEPGGKLRIGYISAAFYDHSVAKAYLGWLQEHDQGKIAVFTYYIGHEVDWATRETERYSTRFLHTPGNLEAACEAIVRDRLHVLVFLDIGMDPMMGLIGALRLAPVQCVTWGHTVTTGLDTIDYYISSSLMEPDQADEHYSERLVRLPGIGISYSEPLIPRAVLLKTRRDFGLREDAVMYLSCQSPQKYLPEHDHVFAKIAECNPSAQFVFLALNELVTADFRRRLDRVFSRIGLDAGNHCVMLPPQGLFDYWNLNLLSDIYLDTMGWSGCNTTMDAIACGLPIVTMPGKFMRGRQSYGILTQLGVTETIAGDEAAYVELAVRLGVDREWRKGVIERMKARFPRLYGDTSCVRALEAFYEQAVSERLRFAG